MGRRCPLSGSVVEKADGRRRERVLRVDPVFEFFQVLDYTIEWWSFPKEHLTHVSVIASNPCNLGVRGGYPKGSGFGQIIPRCSFPEENSLVLDNACQQAEVLDRKLPVLVPVQTGEVIVVPREARRHLARMVDSME